MEAKKKEIEERTYKLRCIFLLKLSNCMCVQVLYVNLMQACIVLLPFIQYSFFISSCISLFPMIHGLKRHKDKKTYQPSPVSSQARIAHRHNCTNTRAFCSLLRKFGSSMSNTHNFINISDIL